MHALAPKCPPFSPCVQQLPVPCVCNAHLHYTWTVSSPVLATLMDMKKHLSREKTCNCISLKTRPWLLGVMRDVAANAGHRQNSC